MPAARSLDVVDDHVQAKAVAPATARPRSRSSHLPTEFPSRLPCLGDFFRCSATSKELKKKPIGDSGWSELPAEILGLLLSRLPRLRDYLYFGAVCKSWRSAQQQREPKAQLPWLVMPDERPSLARRFFSLWPWLVKPDERSNLARRFFSLSDGTVYRLHLPDLRGARCCGSFEDWLIMAHPDSGNFLLNPFTRARIQLPRQPIIQSQLLEGQPSSPSFMGKGVLSCAPTSSSCLFATITFDRDRHLYLCRLVGRKWTVIDRRYPFDDVISYKGCLFAVTKKEQLLVLVPAEQRIKPMKYPIATPMNYVGEKLTNVYLVLSPNKLLMVRRIRDFLQSRRNSGRTRTVKFRVFELQPETLRWTEIHSLGKQILFVGIGGSRSVPLTETSPGGDCIYFTDEAPYYPFDDCGVFFMNDKSIRPLFPTESHSSLFLPLWLPLSNAW